MDPEMVLPIDNWRYSYFFIFASRTDCVCLLEQPVEAVLLITQILCFDTFVPK